MFLFAAVWAISRTYYALYEAEFAWSHLGQDGFDPNLWVSLAAELDLPTQLRLGGALLLALFYFAILWKTLPKENIFFLSKKMVSVSKKGGALKRVFGKAFFQSLFLSIFPFIGSLFVISGYFFCFGKPMHPLYVDEGNIFCRLLYLPGFALRKEFFKSPNFLEKKNGLGAKESAEAGANKILETIEATDEESFSFAFDTTSLVQQKKYAAIPFPGRGRKYNIVLYVLESTSHRYMGLRDTRDRPITPYWDKLSQRALLFERHYAQNPLSINALFNLLTSAYPLPADRWAAKDYPDIALESLPSVLKKSGYKNAVYHGGYFAYAGAGQFLRHQSFDEMLDVRKLKKPEYKTLNWGVDDRAYIKPALQFARLAAKKRKPFFILFLPITPHHPYDSPELPNAPGLPRDWQGARGSNFRKYMRALHFSDLVMGKTVEAFEAQSFGKNTLFFILADHGEAFGQHRRNYNHPFFIYEENVHVPFMLYSPLVIRHPKKVQRLSRHIDIFPTLLDILQLPAPKTIEGRSLLKPDWAQFAPLHTTWRNYLVGLRDGQFKYIYNKRNKKAELYDLARDPFEKNNILKNHKGLAQRFFVRLSDLETYQRRYFEKVLQKKIRWDQRQNKESY